MPPATFYGSDDWEFHEGWENRLDTDAVAQLGRLRELFEPTRLVDAGSRHRQRPGDGGSRYRAHRRHRMDVLDNDYVTAARSPDGTLAVVYLPTARTITVDRAALAVNGNADWVDPASGTRQACRMADDFRRPRARTPRGDDDWLLLITAR